MGIENSSNAKFRGGLLLPSRLTQTGEATIFAKSKRRMDTARPESNSAAAVEQDPDSKIVRAIEFKTQYEVNFEQ